MTVERGDWRIGYANLTSALAMLVAIAGCAGDMEVDADRDPVAVRDSSGVLISENGDSVVPAAWTIREEATVTIGQELRAPPEYQFEAIAGAIRLPDGAVLVADAGDNTLRAYSEDGAFVATWARGGQGPGELRFFGGLARLGTDSVVVWDRWSRRLTVFDENGRVGREVTVRDAPEASLLGAIGPDRLVFERIVEFEYTASEFEAILTGRGDRTGIQRQQGEVEIWDATTGGRVAAIGPHAHTEHHFPSRAVRYYGPVRFARRMIVGVWGSLVIAGPNDTYELRGHGVDGGLERIIRWNRTPIPAEDRHVRAFADENPGRNSDAPMATHLPMFDRVVSDDLGYLWVRDYEMPGEETVNWTAFDAEGAIVTRLTTSDRLRIWEIGRDAVLASRTGELGVHSLVVLSLDRG